MVVEDKEPINEPKRFKCSFLGDCMERGEYYCSHLSGFLGRPEFRCSEHRHALLSIFTYDTCCKVLTLEDYVRFVNVSKTDTD